MFSIFPENRTHKLRLLSFEDAVSNLPNSSLNPKRTLNRTKKKKENKDFKPCSKKTMPNNTTQTSIKDTDNNEFESKKRIQYRTSTVERYRVARLRKEREAARNSLIRLEEETDGRDNLRLFEELEGLCGGSLVSEYERGPLCEKIPYLQWRFDLKLKPIENYIDEDLDHSLSPKGFDSCSCDDNAEQQTPSRDDDAEQQIPSCDGDDDAEQQIPSSDSSSDDDDDEEDDEQYYKEKATAALLYEKLMEWMPPSSSSHADEVDNDWLFKTKDPAAKRQKRVSFLQL